MHLPSYGTEGMKKTHHDGWGLCKDVHVRRGTRRPGSTRAHTQQARALLRVRTSLTALILVVPSRGLMACVDNSSGSPDSPINCTL